MFEVLSSLTWILTIVLDSTWLSHLILRLGKWPEIQVQRWPALELGCLVHHYSQGVDIFSTSSHCLPSCYIFPESGRPDRKKGPHLQVAGQGQALLWDPKPGNCPRLVLTFRKGPGSFFCWNPLLTVLPPDCVTVDTDWVGDTSLQFCKMRPLG